MSCEKFCDARKIRILKPVDVKDLVVLDAGTGEGAMTTFLAKRIGKGVVISVDIDPKCLEIAKKRLYQEGLLDKVSLHKGDLRKLDFIEDNSIDLVVTYDTLGTIEDYTPRGTLPVLKEFFRILKSEGTLCITGDLKILEGPDDAQVVYMRFTRLERAVAELIGNSHDVDFPPDWVKERLEEIGFKDIYRRKIDNGITLDLKYLKEWSSSLRPLIHRITSEILKTAILEELGDIEKAGEMFGFKARPAYAIYARKPQD